MLLQNAEVNVTEITPLAQRFEMSFVPTQPGIATCRASNIEGNDTTDAQVLITDLDNPVHAWGVDENPIAAGDELTLTCGASVYAFSAELFWYLNDIPVEASDGSYILKSSVALSID